MAEQTTDPTARPGDDAHRRLARARLWKRLIRALQVVVTVALFLGVWLVAFGGDESAAPVVPDTTTQFSLDLSVVAASDHDVVYAVEQRARPYYRIFSFDPASGATETIFTVPEDAIIYGIALSPDHATLAVAYSPDFHVAGNGVWTLDLDSEEFTEVIPVEENTYLVDPVWSTNGDSLLATRVDRSTETEVLEIVELSLSDSSMTFRAAGGVSPAVLDDDVYFLQVDEAGARRSIGKIADDGSVSSIEIADGGVDLDHLIAADDATYVAILETDESDGSGLSLGEPADAHGNHEVPATWWALDLGAGDPDTSTPESTPTDLEPIIVYDAAAISDGTIVYATLEGLSIGDGERIDLIKSRAIRFVAA